MKLSTEFGIDPQAPWVHRHNAEVRDMLEAYEADRPIRGPLLCDESALQPGLYATEVDLDYRRYYTDPDEMLCVQLEAARRRRELPIYDFILGEVPAHWPITVDQWPALAPGWIGCELLYRRDTVIAHRPLHLSKDQCRVLSMPDPYTGGTLKTIWAYGQYLREQYEGKLRFLGRPVGPIRHGVGTSGIFAMALDVRGADIMATWCDALERAWGNPDGGPTEGGPLGPFEVTDHGIDMLSPCLYEAFLAPVVVEMNRRRGTRPPTTLHHCGRGAHLFPVIRRRFGLTRLHALTFPLLDIARVRALAGADV